MLTDPKLRSQVDALWDKFWTGGLSNPLDAIEWFAGMVARACPERSRRFESLRGRMGESTRQVEGLFESLLAQAFNDRR